MSFGCSASDVDTEARLIDDGIKWELLSVEADDGSTISTPVENEELSCRFFENGELVVKLFCNGCGGSFEVDQYNHVTISVGSCTEIACPPSIDYNGMLRAVSSYSFEGDELLLYSDSGVDASQRVVLRHRRINEPYEFERE